ncbi:AAA-domain-containing protein [Sanghuangporus baumii]|uniref:Vesicular-fusion protein SEC18 n=1 Tax=Sanghuangporus baumii TaxID=108892 RepID=A0A9Q5N4W6_SANBA|nr:AAA-domain-containing protein [Sanghuangporus baumii]
MSFFGRSSGGGTPSGNNYSRLPPNPGYNAPPPNSRAGQRVPPPRAEDLYEKRSYEQRLHSPMPRGGGGSSSGGAGGFQVVSCPSDALALTNRLILHPQSGFRDGDHVLVKDAFPATVKYDNTGKLHTHEVGASALQRQWMGLSLSGDQISVQPLPAAMSRAYIQSLDLEVGFLRQRHEIAEQFSTDEMAHNFVKAFDGMILGVGEILVFDFHGQNLKAVVKGLSGVEMNGGASVQGLGIVFDKTDVNIVKASDSAHPNAILAPNFKFEDMGIGGLDQEFSNIFRRAFASRVFPPGLVEKLGIQHVKGILLYGPPGTGKTLMARQIGKMLNAREPKIVNGPEILNKFVGASEENIRKLFAEAEAEYKAKGDESGLHIIIFDELDAICKQRGSTTGGTGVGDSVVNQLLSKMDGVDQLNNVLIIGMTNRLDMIDEALLRPGRLEVHMEISLPDENGRLQILNIHTAKMRTNRVMESDVDLRELANLTKNFSGAEISGLVKSATSFAFNRHVGTMAGISDDVENLRVNREDFLSALEEVHPAFGVAEEELQQVIQNGIIHFHPVELLRDGALFVEQVRTSTRTPLVSVLLHGPPGSGKTAMAATIAQASQFPFIKLVSPESMIGMSPTQKIAAINKIFTDSYKSPLSVVVVDNIERLLEWVPIGPNFSNAVLQALLVLLGRRPPKGRRLLIIATTSIKPMLAETQLLEVFDADLRIPPVSSLESLDIVLREVELFPTEEERRRAVMQIEEAGFGKTNNYGTQMEIGIKKLLTYIEMARQEPEFVAERLTSALMGLKM